LLDKNIQPSVNCCQITPERGEFFAPLKKNREIPSAKSRGYVSPFECKIRHKNGSWPLTWWVGTGNNFDPANTVPMPAGTFVTHFGKQVHWDGAKDEDAILLTVGEGPTTSTRVEEAK